MKPNALALALSFASAAAFLLTDGAQARRFGSGSFLAANIHANRVRPGWHGRRYYGWGAAAAGVAAGAAAGAALYNGASCYQQRQVWNGYAYVWQTANVC